jgi:hypothetical protein
LEHALTRRQEKGMVAVFPQGIVAPINRSARIAHPAKLADLTYFHSDRQESLDTSFLPIYNISMIYGRHHEISIFQRAVSL